MFSFIYDKNAFSIALAMSDEGDMDRQLVPMLWFLFGFEMEIIVAPFPRCNIVLIFGAVLYIFVRYLMESDLRCFRGDW